MHVLELILLAVLIAMPIYSAINDKRNRQALIDGTLEKITSYQRTMCFLWLPALMVIAVIWLTPLTAADLGLYPSWSLAVVAAWLVLLLLCCLAAWNLAVLANNSAQNDRYQAQLQPLRWFLPETKQQCRWFVWGVSPTAGVCEELIFRGYLLWLLEPYLGMPGAIGLSSLLFGLNHLYQGWWGVLTTALIGVAFGLVYWVTGSLWIAILLHTLVDVYAGLQSYLVFRVKQVEFLPSSSERIAS